MSIRDRLREAKQEMLLKQGVTPEPTLPNPKTHKTLDKLNLDVASYSTEEIRRYNAQSINKIRQDMTGNGLIKMGVVFSGSATEKATLGYLSALVEQNWILIRQNELLIKVVDKSNKPD